MTITEFAARKKKVIKCLVLFRIVTVGFIRWVSDLNQLKTRLPFILDFKHGHSMVVQFTIDGFLFDH